MKVKKTRLTFKILSLIICTACLLSSVILLGSCKKKGENASGTPDLEYKLNSAGTEYSVTGYTGNKDEITVPEKYNDIPVVAVADSAFKGNTTIKTVTLPGSVTSIGDEAFAKCTALETINFPAKISTLGYGCFQNCSSLKSVKIPEGVDKLPVALFDGCSALTSVELPASLSVISFVSFIGCDNLMELKVAEGNTTYHSNGNCIIKTEEKTLVIGAGSSVIPTDGSVVTIGENAFYGKKQLSTIAFPECVKLIEQYAFYGCSSLRYARLTGVTAIEDGAFNGCTSLRYVVFPTSLNSIGDIVFSKCVSLNNVYYLGTDTEWKTVSIDSTTLSQLENVSIYYYSATEPETEGNYWYYSGTNIVQWKK